MAGISGLGSVAGMAQSLQQSIDAAMKRVQDQAQQEAAAAKPAGEVEAFEQTVNKSKLNAAMFATNIGTLTKDSTRLNVFSSLAASDPADFYKFSVTTKGEATIGRVGDSGVRVQLLNRTGTVIADSDEGAGAAHDAYKQLEKGELTLEKGDYTLRVARDRNLPLAEAKSDKNYGVQFSMGTYAKDYDTIAKQPAKGDNPFQNNPELKSLGALLTTGGTAGRLGLLLGEGTGSTARGSLINGLF
ncbi:hypothetical protein [Azospirillum sp. SYSU D00513]|uniref:hypothetical protein n=1 Tax=Azospirillum sp. SYSU D00513 TaxID=2812561 RepID=UPI001A965533|nr:hypothetical protein [Azospirillum sp. SYSU D00513]